MKKRVFQVLDEMNVADAENKTANLLVSPYLVSAQTAKGGGNVIMGVPAEVIHRLTFEGEKLMTLLLVIDKDEYEKLDTDARP